jgi:hypothetical protein
MARIVHGSIHVFACPRGVRPAPSGPFEEPGMSFLKQKLSLPLVKFGVLGVAGCLWLFGLVDQLYSSAAMMKYLLLSLLMAAVAFL